MVTIDHILHTKLKHATHAVPSFFSLLIATLKNIYTHTECKSATGSKFKLIHALPLF